MLIRVESSVTLHIKGEHYVKQTAVLEMTLVEMEDMFSKDIPAMKTGDDIKKAIDVASGLTVDAVWIALQDQMKDFEEL